MSDNIQSVEATYGEKTIETRVRFGTDDIADTERHILPKHCWTSGTIKIPKNDSHGIGSGKAKPFNSLMQIADGIEQILIEAGVRMHTGGSNLYLPTD